MKKVLLVAMVVFVAAFSTTAAFADEKKGQKIIIKKLKADCGFNGGELAKKHTQAEWKSVYEAGNLPAEIQEICPQSKPLKDKFYPHVYDFLYNYALDSGNVPSC